MAQDIQVSIPGGERVKRVGCRLVELVSGNDSRLGSSSRCRSSPRSDDTPGRKGLRQDTLPYITMVASFDSRHFALLYSNQDTKE